MPLDLDWIRARLPGRDVVWYPKIDSTMIAAAQLARGGCASGTAVLAEEQTAGQGRYGRQWYSEPEAGLYVSLVLRLGFPAETLPVVALALGLAAAEAILKASGLASDLRWPNDVLAGGRKCAGVLVQLQEAAVIAGIGVNVNHVEFPEDLRAIATSLRLETGRRQSREALLVHLLGSIDAAIQTLVTEGKPAILRLFAGASSYVHGRRVVVEQGESSLTGVTAGLDESGFLLLRKDDGTRAVIVAGGVRPTS